MFIEISKLSKFYFKFSVNIIKILILNLIYYILCLKIKL